MKNIKGMSVHAVHVDDTLRVSDQDRVLPRCNPAEYSSKHCLYATYDVRGHVNYDDMWDEGPGEFNGHPLYRLVYTAYMTHLPLHLHPEDFQFVLDAIVSQTVHADPERFRHLLVAHTGKRVLEVKVVQDENDFEAILDELGAQVRAEVSPTLVSAMAADFSTSTALDQRIATTYLLGTTAQYYEYHAGHGCGISQVYLHGTVEDWRRLVDKANTLGEALGGTTQKYIQAKLLPVFEGLLKERQGEHSPAFWQKMISDTEQLYVWTWSGWIMSMYPQITKDASTGALLYRTRYDDTGDAEDAMSCVLVHLIESDRNIRVRGGPVGIEQLPDGSLQIVRGMRVELVE